MKIAVAFLLLGAVTTRLCAEAVESKPVSTPIRVISANVSVSVGRTISLFEGHYWVQYLQPLDTGLDSRLLLQRPIFVPRGVDDLSELRELTQLKFVIDGREFPPSDVALDPPETLDWLHPGTEDGTIAWFTFDIPRQVASVRFEVVITWAQQNYKHDGETIAAYLPWLPDFDRFKMKERYFDVTFDALDGVEFSLASPLTDVLESSSTHLRARPVHRENIAVSILPAPSEARN